MCYIDCLLVVFHYLWGWGNRLTSYLWNGWFHNTHLFSQKWTPIQYFQHNWEYAFPNRNSQQGILVFILLRKSSNFWKHCGSSSSPGHGARQMEDYFIQWNICPVIVGLRKTRRECFERPTRVRVILSQLWSVAHLLGLRAGPPCCCAVRLTVIVLWEWEGQPPLLIKDMTTTVLLRGYGKRPGLAKRNC